MKPSKFALLLLLLLPATAVLGAEQAEPGLTRFALSPKDVEARSGTHWYGVYIGRQKVGWFCDAFAARGRGEDRVWVATQTGVLKIAAMKQKTEFRMTEELVFSARPPYELVGASSSQTQTTAGRSKKQSVRLARENGAYRGVVRAGGETMERTVPSLDYTLGDHLASELWIRRSRPGPGAVLRSRSFELDRLEMDVTVATVRGMKTTMASGVRLRFFEIHMRDESGGPSGLARVNEKGHLLSMVIGGFAEARREPEAAAKKIAYSRDLFVHGMARLDKPLGMHPREAARLVLRVAGEAADKLRSAGRQTVTRDAKGVVLTVTAGPGRGPKATETQRRLNLRDTLEYPARHERVRNLARLAVGDAASDEAKVRRLLGFVAGYIDDSYEDQALSLFDILRTRRGDCSEHAQLFVALARAAGLPAREVSGLAYMGDGVKAFGGHAWCEVVLQGRWVEVDPTWNQFRVDATHIWLASGRDEGLATFGKIGFALQAVESAAGKD